MKIVVITSGSETDPRLAISLALLITGLAVLAFGLWVNL